MKTLLSTIDTPKLEKILCLMINENTEYLGIPETFFRTNEAKELLKQIRYNHIWLKQKYQHEHDKQEKQILESFTIEQVIQELQNRKAVELAPFDFSEKKKILTLKDKYNNEFHIYEKTLYGITGFNGHGKTAFLIYISYLLSQKYKVLYCLNEDKSIPRKLKPEVLQKIIFLAPKNIEGILDLTFSTQADIVCIDAITSAKFSESKTSIRIIELQDILWSLFEISQNKTIFVVNHLKKKFKEENIPDNPHKYSFIYNSYLGNFANLLDVGFAVIKGKGVTKIKVEKDRETDIDETMLNTLFEFDFFKIRKTIMKEGA